MIRVHGRHKEGDNMANRESILTSIKKLLGPEETYEHFDDDIIIHINASFMTLTQLGVGPKRGFSISDKEAVWTDFIPEDSEYEYLTAENVKTYVYAKVKLVFDPPQSSAVIAALERIIQEFEWRLSVAAETPKE